MWKLVTCHCWVRLQFRQPFVLQFVFIHKLLVTGSVNPLCTQVSRTSCNRTPIHKLTCRRARSFGPHQDLKMAITPTLNVENLNVFLRFISRLTFMFSQCVFLLTLFDQLMLSCQQRLLICGISPVLRTFIPHPPHPSTPSWEVGGGAWRVPPVLYCEHRHREMPRQGWKTRWSNPLLPLPVNSRNKLIFVYESMFVSRTT